MKVIESGHIYELKHLDGKGKQRLTFLKRSSKMIDYGKDEHAGTNTQELFRVIIDLLQVAQDRSQYLNDVQTCAETEDAVACCETAIQDVRKALYSYEVRAYRRKQAKLNKQAGKHNDEGNITADRTSFKDIPFSADKIEELTVGKDGHILCKSPRKE